jgi:hypothetical protein
MPSGMSGGTIIRYSSSRCPARPRSCDLDVGRRRRGLCVALAADQVGILARTACRRAGFRERASKAERSIWQRRFWEHTLRNEEDFARHTDYNHYNPVKHGYVNRVRAGSIRRFIGWSGLPSTRLIGQTMQRTTARTLANDDGFRCAEPTLWAACYAKKCRLNIAYARNDVSIYDFYQRALKQCISFDQRLRGHFTPAVYCS